MSCPEYVLYSTSYLGFRKKIQPEVFSIFQSSGALSSALNKLGLQDSRASADDLRVRIVCLRVPLYFSSVYRSTHNNLGFCTRPLPIKTGEQERSPWRCALTRFEHSFPRLSDPALKIVGRLRRAESAFFMDLYQETKIKYVP